MIGLVSGTVTAGARSLGHTISFYTTAALMLLVGGVLVREPLYGARVYAPTCKTKWGPFLTFVVAAMFIMIEPTRHMIGDSHVWSWCGNNAQFDRINSTDAFPSQCAWSNTQYHCSQVCCVSTWTPTNSSDPATAYAWQPPSSDFFPDGPLPGPFATLRADGSIYTPPGHANAPYALYKVGADQPLVFYETGEVNPLRVHSPAAGCLYGANPATGYCFLTNQSLSYEEQLLQLPTADISKPYNATSNPHVCGCDGCTPTEDFGHLSVVGVLSTIVCTYVGFVVLAIAVSWNANIMGKMSKIAKQWRKLRARAQVGEPQLMPLRAQ